MSSWTPTRIPAIAAGAEAAGDPAHVADPSAQLLMLQKGDIDIARNLGADQLKTIANNPDFHVPSAPQARTIYIAMNQRGAGPREAGGAAGDQVGDRL